MGGPRVGMSHSDCASAAAAWALLVDAQRKFVSACHCLTEDYRELLARGAGACPKLSSSQIDGIFGNIADVHHKSAKALRGMESVHRNVAEPLSITDACQVIDAMIDDYTPVFSKYAVTAALAREYLRTLSGKNKQLSAFLSENSAGEQFLCLGEACMDDSSKSMACSNHLKRLLSVPVGHPLRLVTPLMRLFLAVPVSESASRLLFSSIARLNELYWHLRQAFRTGSVRAKLTDFASSVGDLSIVTPKAPYREIMKKGVVQYHLVKSKKSGGIVKRMWRRNTKLMPSKSSSFKERTIVLLNDSLAVLDLNSPDSMMVAFLEYSKIDFSTFQHEINGTEVQVAKIVDHKLNGHFFIEGEEGKGFFRSVSKMIDRHERRVFGRPICDVVTAQEKRGNRPRSMIHRSSSMDELEVGDEASFPRSASMSAINEGSPRSSPRSAPGTPPRTGSSRRRVNSGGFLSALSASSRRFFSDASKDSAAVPLLVEHLMFQLVTCASVGVVEELFAADVNCVEWRQLRARMDNTAPEVRNIQRRSPFTILLLLIEWLRTLPVPLLQLCDPRRPCPKRKKLRKANGGSDNEMRRAFLNYCAELSAHSDSYALLALEVVVYSCLQMMTSSSLPREVSKRVLALWLGTAVVHPADYCTEFVSGAETMHAMDVFMFMLDHAGDYFALCERRKLMRGSLTHDGGLPSSIREILLDDGSGRWWKGVLLEQDSLMKHVAARFVPDLIHIAIATPSDDVVDEEEDVLREKALLVLSRRTVLLHMAEDTTLLDMLYDVVFGEDGAAASSAMPSEFKLAPASRLLTVMIKAAPDAMRFHFNTDGHRWVTSLMSCIASSNVAKLVLSLTSHQRIAKNTDLGGVIELLACELLTVITNEESRCSESVYEEAAHVISTLIRTMTTWGGGNGLSEVPFKDRLASHDAMHSIVSRAVTDCGEAGKGSCDMVRTSLEFLPDSRPVVFDLLSTDMNLVAIQLYFQGLCAREHNPTEYTLQLIMLIREVVMLLISSHRFTATASGGILTTSRTYLDLMRVVAPQFCSVWVVYPAFSILHSHLVPFFSFMVTAICDKRVGRDLKEILRNAAINLLVPRCVESVASSSASLRIAAWRTLRFFSQQTEAMEVVLASVPEELVGRYRACFEEALKMELEPPAPKAQARGQWWVFNLDILV